MKYETTLRGLTIDNPGHGWCVIHASSKLEAVSGLRQRRFAEQARDELLATGADFTADTRSVQKQRELWADVYFRWQSRAKCDHLDPETWEYYPQHCRYGQFIPSAQWAASMRAAIADYDPDAIRKLLDRPHAKHSVRIADARILTVI